MDTQPGQVFVPHDDGSESVEPQPQQPQAGAYTQGQEQPPQQPSVTAQAMPDAPATQAVGDDQDQGVGWAYSQGVDAAEGGLDELPEDVTWSASEFVEHPKSAGWYALLIAAGLVLAALDYFFTKDIVSTSVIVIAAAMFGVYAGHKPRTRDYHLGPDGLQIADKVYVYQSYKAFSVIEEGATVSIILMPLGRFAAPITLYVAHDMEDKVLDYLSLFLPMERHKTDAVDGLLRKIRF